MNFDNLKKLSREQLVEVAGKQGIPVHHKAKPETIIKQILDHTLVPQKPQVAAEAEYIDPRLKSVKEPIYNTKEQVEAMLSKIRATKPEFESHYDDEARSVTFRYKGAEDCHNLSVPLHWLKVKADIVARGRIAPMGHDTREWGSIHAQGPNAYTNTILASF